MSFDFDPRFRPQFGNLTGAARQKLDEHFDARRAQGLNVQFLDKRGARDEWSFATPQARDTFIHRLEDERRPYAVSKAQPTDLFAQTP